MKLILNNTILPFQGKIKVKRLSPFLNNDLRMFSYEFSLDSCPVVDIALGFAVCPDALVEKVVYKNFRIDSKFFHYLGTLTLRSVADNKYKLYFIGDYLQGNCKDFKITKLDKEYKVWDYLYNDGLTDCDYVRKVPVYLPAINNSTTDIGNFQFGSIVDTPEIPHFKLKKVINQVFERFGIRPIYDLGDISKDFDDLCLFCNYALNVFKLAPYGQYKPATYHYENNELFFLIYDYSDGDGSNMSSEIIYKFSSSIENWPIEGKYYKLELVEYISDVAENEHHYWKMKAVGFPVLPAYNGTINLQLVKTINLLPYYYDDTVNEEIKHPISFSIGKCLPNVSFGELIKALEDLLFIKFVFNDTTKECRIVKQKNILLGSSYISISPYYMSSSDIIFSNNNGYYYSYTPSSDDEYFNGVIRDKEDRHNELESVETIEILKSLPNPRHNDYRFVKQANAFYEYVQNIWDVRQQSGIEGSWQFYSFNFNNTLSQEASFKLVSKACPLAPAQEHYVSTIIGKNPYLVNIGYGGPVYFQDKQESNNYSSIRLFFYRGIYEYKPIPNSLNSYLWVSATVTDKDIFGEKVEGANLSLDYVSENGIPNRLGKEVMEWLSLKRKNINALINWPEHLFFNLDFCQKVELHSNLYLVNSIDFEVDEKDNITWGVTELAKV